MSQLVSATRRVGGEPADGNSDRVPIIAGFHPDPSVCRVGDDYFLATSSFEFAPAIPIWHSRDLVSWSLIGNAWNRDDQFLAGHHQPQRGIWAPTLRHHAGRFWIIATDVAEPTSQKYTWATDPAGPWSSVQEIGGLEGIDPDLAWDDDGTCYLTYCSTAPDLPGIAQARVDLASGTRLEEPRQVWAGTGLPHAEGPHLYHIGSWWYLVIAEGGTASGHLVSVARSRRPQGPFEGAPTNPIFTHRSTRHPVQNVGHADLVRAPDDSWAMVYLGVRVRGVTPRFHVNGRETFAAGIEWADGWPEVVERKFDVPLHDHSFTDTFEGQSLDPRWVSPGSAPADLVASYDGEGIVVTPRPSCSASASMIATRTRDEVWRFEVTLEPGPGAAAVRLRLDERHWCEVLSSGGHARARLQIGPLTTELGTVALPAGRATLAIEAVSPSESGPDDLRLLVGNRPEEIELARFDGRYLSTEVAGGFTGRVVGVRPHEGLVRIFSTHYAVEQGACAG